VKGSKLNTDNEGWIGVDLDRTLAYYDHDQYKQYGSTFIGAPILPMVNLVRDMLYNGENVRIFTARVYPIVCVIVNDAHASAFDTIEERQAKNAANAIRKWCFEQFGQYLPITCIKDYSMKVLYDDRAIAVEPNVGNIRHW
jgi:hypothetical protein